MPHFIVEYSENLAAEIDFSALFLDVHNYLTNTKVFSLDSIKSRAIALTDYRIADGLEQYAFIYFRLKIASGRDLVVRKQIADGLFEQLTAFFADLQQQYLLDISFEMSELHPILYYNKNNITEFLNAD